MENKKNVTYTLKYSKRRKMPKKNAKLMQK